jgi:hypothetical protein
VSFKQPYPPEIADALTEFPALLENKDHISLTPVTVGQWFRGTKYAWDLKVVDNGIYKQIPIEVEPKTIPELLGIS